MKGFGVVSKWLYPGLGIKRWLVLLAIGITFIGVGVAFVLAQIDYSVTVPDLTWYLTLQFVPHPWRAILFVSVGFALAGLAVYRLNRSILTPFIYQANRDVWGALYAENYLKHGPRIVAIGGGTGLSTLLRGLKEYTSNITAIVTVADDGGSSGRLRRELGILPPGDFRQCIAALADTEPLMTRLFEYRFEEGSGLEGHSFGNLFIAAMTAITGNFERALLESSRVLAVRGYIVPSTLADVTLCAEFEDKVVINGEHLISERRRPIRRMYLEPAKAPGYREALRAIEKADLIVVGPGSLYTSVIPNLLVQDLSVALKKSKAIKVYVCNVAAQLGETEGFSVGEHVQVLVDQLGEDIFDYVLANNNFRAVTRGSHHKAVPIKGRVFPNHHHRLVLADLVDAQNVRLHDPRKLAESLVRLSYDQDQSKVA